MRLADLIEEGNHNFYGMIGDVFETGLIFLWSWLQKPKFRTQLFATGHPECFSRQAMCLRVFDPVSKANIGLSIPHPQNWQGALSQA